MISNLSVVIPVFNEEKSIKHTISALKKGLGKTGVNFEILVVNDGSKDKTGEILKNIEGIETINHLQNKGYGGSLKTGIKNAKYEKVLIIDADATYPIKKVQELLRWAGKYDMVVGARIGKNVHIPFFRKIGKKIVSAFANFALGKKIPDLNSGFRIFNKKIVFENIGLFPSGFSFTTTLTMIHAINDLDTKFVPIDYFKREGKSSIKPFRDFIGFLTLITRIAIYYNPLKFFIPPGIVILLLGTIYLFRNLIFFSDIPDGSIFLILFGIQIIFTGFLADILAIKRKAK